MKVTCSRCGTEYNFDDSKVTEEGVKVKCTRCENVFRVRKKAYAITEPVQAGGQPPMTAEPAEDTSSTTYSGATPRQWMIRRTSGEKLEFKEMTTLQRWIVEHKVGSEDEISHNGVKWKRLGAIPELGPFFKVVEDEDADAAARATARQDPRTSTGEFLRAQEPGTGPHDSGPPLGGEAPDARRAERPPASAMNAWGDDRPTNKPARDPSTAERAVEAGARGTTTTPAAAPRRTRRGFVWLGLAAIAGGGAYWAQFTPEGFAATAPARAWLLANTGLDLGGGTAEATPTAVVAASPTPGETPVVPASPIAADSATPAPTASEVAVTTPVPTATPKPTRVAVAYDVDTLLQQGYEAYSRGQYREAIRKYQAAVNAAPDNSEAYALLGLAYLDSGNDDLAESSLEAAIRLNPRFADAHRYLGMLYARRSDKARAITAFRKYLDLRPNGPTSDDVRRRVASLEGG